MEPDLSNYFNFGLVPPPDLDWEPPRLRKPAWLPSTAQVQSARWQLALIGVVLMLFFVFMAFFGRS